MTQLVRQRARLLMNYWGLATLVANGERLAVENCRRQEFEVYSPQFMDRRIVRGKVTWSPAPLFQGYLFVGICDRFRSLFGTKGIASVLTNGVIPTRVRTSEIEKIRQLEVDGFVLLPHLPKFKASGFSLGDSVSPKSGPMSTYVGIYSGQRRADRVKVLFRMLGAETSVYIREDDLAAA